VLLTEVIETVMFCTDCHLGIGRLPICQFVAGPVNT